ncbi:sulfotransferase family protein [Jannaschia formosa]|uniref:sulfotransferase family protein n=1 Tax=Jannaschia formosa TaxID=2259592 RepID=UPI000E1B87FE|nr:sulfotransferase [Jannaschia formosa]TFL19360.1 sulfotransferase [Jannaschia formosa]
METPPDPSLRELSVFVVGYPRSGTTLLRRLLTAHPDLCILPETLALRRVSAAWRRGLRSEGDIARAFAALPERDRGVFDRAAFAAAAGPRMPMDRAAALSLLYATAPMARDRPSARLGHKFPADTPAVPILARWYPRARFVHIHRHPAEAVGSLFAHGLQGRAKRPEIAAWHWRHYMRLLARAEAGPAAGRLHVLSLPALLAAPEAELTRLCVAIGLDPGGVAAMLADDRPDHATERSEAGRPHMLRSRRALGEAGEAAPDPLGPGARRRIATLCAPEMRRLGYRADDPGPAVERMALAGLSLGLGAAFAALRARRRLRGEV